MKKIKAVNGPNYDTIKEMLNNVSQVNIERVKDGFLIKLNPNQEVLTLYIHKLIAVET